MERFVVVGGGAAGMSAASVARRRDPELEVVVIEKGQHISFSACGMPYWIGETVEGPADRLVVRTPEEARERGLEVRTGTEVTGIDAQAKTVALDDGQDTAVLEYDALCLSPGLEARTPWPECELPGVHALRHLDDGIRLQRELEDNEPDTACIVGGGFIGLEMAEALQARGIATTLVHSRATLMNGILDAELGELVNQRVQEAGVELITEARAQGLEGQDRVEGVDLGQRVVDAELVILAIGAVPRTALAEQAGCSIEPATGTIQVDPGMRTDVPDIYACGDAVAFEHRLTGKPTFLPLALHANRSGRIAGENVVGGDHTFPGVLGTAVTTFEEMEIAATGLTVQAAQAAGMEAAVEQITSVTKAGYFPGSSKVHARMTVEQGTGRVLGCQLVGGPGTGKRIDTVAAAIWMGATAEDLAAMDLAYAPPVSPTWDPVAIAARIAGRQA